MQNDTKIRFRTELKKIFLLRNKNRIKEFIFEKLALPILERISGIDPFLEWIQQCGVAGNPDDLNKNFSKLGTKTNFHYNVSPTTKSIFVFNHPTGLFEYAFIQRTVQFFGLKGCVLGDEVVESVPFVKGTYIPLDIRTKDPVKKKNQLNNIKNHIESGQSLIIFPAGAVSNKN